MSNVENYGQSAISPLKIVLIDQDPIFRLGLRVILEETHDLEILGIFDTDTNVLKFFSENYQKDPVSINLIVLEISSDIPSLSSFSNPSSTKLTNEQLGLQLCHELKRLYPDLPILLLTSVLEPTIIIAAQNLGVEGYCSKGTSVGELIIAMHTVADGNSYGWENLQGNNLTNTSLPLSHNSFSFAAKLKKNLCASGITHINVALKEVIKELQTPGLPLIDKVILAGKKRELYAARWLINQFFVSSSQEKQEVIDSKLFSEAELVTSANILESARDTKVNTPLNNSNLVSPRTLQSVIIGSCISHLQNNLQNVTNLALEIDIIRANKKRELLYLVLQKLANTLEELRKSEIDIITLYDLKKTILVDLWKEASSDFFGKFSRIEIGNNYIELVSNLLQDENVVEKEILEYIPFVTDLLSYLLFQTELQIDNVFYPPESKEAIEYAEMLLENLLIQVANAVIQPLLNRFADVEKIKSHLYDTKLISTREIEKFRNELSWKYRWRNYIGEPQKIFESRHEIFVFAPRGIAKTFIYAPRRQELEKLSGIPLVVTLGLEFRDAIAPRLKAVVALFGSGFVFILTNIIGKGIGLIGKGILQGIGSVYLMDRKK
jgi:DNA-binding NarL/FixJ family response regulator